MANWADEALEKTYFTSRYQLIPFDSRVNHHGS